MNASSRDELFGVLAELRLLFPDWRFGQLVANLAMAAGRDCESAIWDLEDEELVTAGRRLIERNSDRLMSNASQSAVS